MSHVMMLASVLGWRHFYHGIQAHTSSSAVLDPRNCYN